MRSANKTMMIRTQRWKLIENNLGSGGFSKPNRVKPTKHGPQGQLYDMENDLGETRNLWNTHPQRVDDLRIEMNRIISSGSNK